MNCNIIVALVVFDTIIRVRKEPLWFRTFKIIRIRVRSTAVIIAVSSVTVSVSAADILRKVTPVMHGIEQIVILTNLLVQASIVAFPVQGAVLRIWIRLGKDMPSLQELCMNYLNLCIITWSPVEGQDDPSGKVVFSQPRTPREPKARTKAKVNMAT